MTIWYAIASAVIAIVSAIYSYVEGQSAAKRAKKAREAAENARKAAEDAAKGFQIPVEGQSAPLPVYYGRNLAGGIRVYHGSFNSINLAAYHPSCIYAYRSMGTGWFPGEKHEYLMVQQALCKGPITQVIAVDIDEMPNTDAIYGGYHDILVYSNGGVADPTAGSNDGSRWTATFPGISYANCVFRLNRDDPNYSGVPMTQFYILGAPVEYIGHNGFNWHIAGTAYSNNPARCLLNYLLNKEYGRGLSVEELDLESFYKASVVCDRHVLTVPREGRLWNTLGTERQIRLFECNIAVDTSKPVRDNIEKILETMGLAELIWSDGKYSLSLHYPMLHNSGINYTPGDIVQGSYNGQTRLLRSIAGGNAGSVLTNTTYWANDVIVADITDDDIIRGAEMATIWPDAQTRLNYATVHFLNESKDFTNDSASWPSKYGYIPGANTDRGAWQAGNVYRYSDSVNFGGTYYQLAVNPTFYSTVSPKLDPTHWTLLGAGYSSSSMWVSGTSYYLNDTRGISETINGETVVSVYKLTSGPGYQSSAMPDTDGAWVAKSNLVYSIYKSQDAEMPLEGDFHEEGISTYYHALAKAEQRVRQSRDMVMHKMTVSRSKVGIEPGDIVFVNSDILYIPGELMRVEAIKISKEGHLELSAYKYDARLLAWNVADNEVVLPRNIYDVQLLQATALTLDLVTQPTQMTSLCYLRWTLAADSRVAKYSVRYTLAAPGNVDANTEWVEIGTTENNFFEIPYLDEAVVTLSVVAQTSSGRTAPRFTAASKWPTLLLDTGTIAMANITNLAITVDINGLVASWTTSFTARYVQYEIRTGYDWSSGTKVGITSGSSYRLPFQAAGEFHLMVKTVSKTGKYSATATDTRIQIIAPAAPQVTSQVVDNNVLLYWTQPTSFQPIKTYEIKRGLINQTYENAMLIGEKSGLFTTVFETQSGSYKYWVTAIDAAGNYGTPASEISSVSQPPDYNFIADFYTTFTTSVSSTVTKINCSYDGTSLVIPTYPTETFERHHLQSLAGDVDSFAKENCTVLRNASDPFGGNYAYAISRTAVGNHYLWDGVTQSCASKTFTFSVYLKAGTMTGNIILRIRDGVGTNESIVVVTPTATLTRYSVTKTFPAGATANPIFIIDPVNDTGSIGDTFIVSHPQIVEAAAMKPVYSTPQSQITDGKPYYLQPTPTGGRYEEILDYGAGFQLQNHVMKLDVIITYLRQVSTQTTVISLETSADGISWAMPIYGTFIYASGFRYIRVRIDVTSDALGFIEIEKIRYATDTKLKNESGTKYCNAGDVGGTVVAFADNFFDIMGITLSPAVGAGGVPLIAVYDFVDTPNPTSFKILLFTLAGVRASGNVSWSIKGY